MTHFTAVIQPEILSTGEPIFVAHCPEIDVASQGNTREEALANLKEAIELLYEVGGETEIRRRLAQGVSVLPLDLELVAA